MLETNEVRALLGADQIDQALAALLSFLTENHLTDLRDQAIVQQGRWAGCKRLRLAGAPDGNTENLVRLSLLDLCTEADRRRNVPAPAAPMRPSQAPKFVVIYTKEDAPAATELNRQFTLLKRTGKVRFYNVHSDLGAGDVVAEAQSQAADADYVLCLVSDRLVNEEEGQWLDLALQFQESGRRVIPILLDKTNVEGTGLEKLRSLPTQGRAVVDFPDKNAAWFDIATDLRKLIPK